MKAIILSIILSGAVLGAGCADMDVPGPKEFISDPLGEGSLKKGMSKEEVMDKYGEPDMIGTVYSEEWKESREEWIYNATYSGLPIGAGYLTKDLYLYFDGDNLTNISRESLGKMREVRENVQ